MDTIDSSKSSNLPSPLRAVPPPLPVLPRDFSGDLATAPTSQVNSKTLLRGLVRHWWQILLVWLVVSIPVVFLIHRFIEPTYEAVSVLRVTPESGGLFEATSSEHLDFRGVAPYLQTQVTLITSDRVLGVAIANPEVARLSTITESDDPRAELRKKMTVGIVKDAYLIRVALELADPNQAAAIVNAVVGSYLAYNGEHSRSANSKLRQSLVAQLEKYKTAINDKRAELKQLVSKGNVSVSKPINPNPSKSNSDGSQPVIMNVSEEQSEKLMQDMINTELEIIKVESDIKAREDELAGEMSEKSQEQLSKASDEQLEQQIRNEFRKDPEVLGLTDEIALAAEQRDRAKAIARKAGDPARRMSEQKYKALMEEYDALWRAKYDEIRDRLKTAASNIQRAEVVDELRNKTGFFERTESEAGQIVGDAQSREKSH